MNIQYLLSKYQQGQMARYLEVAHSALEENKQRFIEWADSAAAEMEEEERSDFYGFYQDEAIEVEYDFPRQLYSNFVTSWYSFIEQELMSLCKYLDLKITVTIRDRESLGKGVRRAYKFLSKAANYEVDPSHWQEILNVGRVRNWIVHQGLIIPHSYLPGDSNQTVKFELDGGNTVYLQIDQDFYKYLEKHGAIAYFGLFYLSPTYDYCKHLVDLGKEFLEKIYTDLGQK